MEAAEARVAAAAMSSSRARAHARLAPPARSCSRRRSSTWSTDAATAAAALGAARERHDRRLGQRRERRREGESQLLVLRVPRVASPTLLRLRWFPRNVLYSIFFMYCTLQYRAALYKKRTVE